MPTKYRYYTTKKQDDEWERTDKRGYGDLFYAQENSRQLSKRNGGQEVGILFKGEIIEIWFNGEIKPQQEGI